MERVWLSILVPIGALLGTALIIALFGIALLIAGGEHGHDGFAFLPSEITRPVVVALVISLVVLVAAALMARGGAASED